MLNYNESLITDLEDYKNKLQNEINKRVKIEQDLAVLREQYEENVLAINQSKIIENSDKAYETTWEYENFEEVVINTNKFFKKIAASHELLTVFQKRILIYDYKNLISNKSFDSALIKLTQFLFDLADVYFS